MPKGKKKKGKKKTAYRKKVSIHTGFRCDTGAVVV